VQLPTKFPLEIQMHKFGFADIDHLVILNEMSIRTETRTWRRLRRGKN
jgi:hypothetical protein